MPLQKRLPKFGFSSRISRTTAQIRLSELNTVEGDVIDLAALKNADLINDNIARVRVFLSGELGKAVATVARAFGMQILVIRFGLVIMVVRCFQLHSVPMIVK